MTNSISFDYEESRDRDEPNVLDKLSDAYYDKFIREGGRNDIANDGVHYFWHEMESRFNFRIVWHSHQLVFATEKDYFTFILKHA